jgi:uncharacterized membrane protein
MTFKGMRHGWSMSLHDLTRRNVETVRRLEDAAVKEGPMDRVADAVTRFCGSLSFFIINLAWYAAWIVINTWGPWQFDPYPYTFLTLCVSLEAIFLSIFILMSENRQAILDKRRAELDLQVNLLAEQENTKQLHLLKAIAAKVGLDLKYDKELQALEQEIHPDSLAAQIDHAEK